MKQFLATLLILAFIGILVPLFLMGHHGGYTNIACLTSCYTLPFEVSRNFTQALQNALLLLIVLVLAVLGVVGLVFLKQNFSYFRHRPLVSFRHRFDRWFSLLEHSPTL